MKAMVHTRVGLGVAYVRDRSRRSDPPIWRVSSAVPFFGGTLSEQPGRTRTPIQNAAGTIACEGGYAFHFSQAYMANESLSAGNTVNGQYWTRDPNHPDGTGVGLTDAIEFTVEP